MNDIQIFGRHTSYNVQKVLWLADELELQYTHAEVGGSFGGNDTVDFLRMNPMGKVPVLRENGKVIWESNTIVRYLADCYSPGKWISSEPFERSLTDRWMDWSIDRLEPAFVGAFWGYYRTPSDHRDLTVIQASIDDCNLCLTQIAHQLDQNKYLLGECPTVADVAIGVFMYRLISMGLEFEIPANVNVWHKRLFEREAYKKWVMSDFSELKGRLSY